MGKKYKIPKGQPTEPESTTQAENAQPSLDKVLAEMHEAAVLLQQGADFKVQYTETTGWLFWKKKRQRVRTFTLEEPTLSILDEISAIALQFDYSEKELKAKDNTAAVSEARRAVHANAQKLAEIIAIAALGEEGCYEIRTNGGLFRAKKNKKKIQSLAAQIYHIATPSQIHALATKVATISNLPNFIASIRLLSARTTQPENRIE